MWVVSCSDAHWEGRRKWLRPGTKHLFGRSSTRPDEVDLAHNISHKTVSRKHLILTVGNVSSNDTTNLHSKSSITIVGQGKTGTWLDGQRLPAEDQTRTLSGDKHTLQLGNQETTLTLEWQPVVLAFTSGVPKSAKAKGTALAAERQKLDRCDIKIAAEYIPNTTTHAIAKKRNTPPVLQALLQAKWVVSASFVDALAAACKRDGKEQDGSPRTSLLEQDFDQNWPNEEEHICPSANEPVSRPDSWLKPNPARCEVFQDYTFVFLEGDQHNILAPVVNAGNGKALCFPFTLGQTKVEEAVHYVRDVSGNKETDRFTLSDQSGSGGILIIRARDTDTFNDVHRQLDAALGQISIEQNEFLDAILSVDATMLRRPLPRKPGSGRDAAISSSIPTPPDTTDVLSPKVSASSFMPRPPQGTSDSVLASTAASQQPPTSAQLPPQSGDQAEPQAEEPPSAPPARKRRRFVTQKFQGFDDFDPTAVKRPRSKSPVPSAPQPSQSETPVVQSKATNEEPLRPASPVGQRRAQKRPAPVEEDDEVTETAGQRYERMFPGQAALKRRKTEEAEAAAAKKAAAVPTEQPAQAAPEAIQKEEVKNEKPKGKAKQSKQDADIKARITAKREEEEEQHRREEERLLEGLAPGEEIPDLGNVAKHPGICVEYELPIRDPRPTITVSDNPNWTGRPNYKKFKKRRPAFHDNNRAETPNSEAGVIIALEEIQPHGSALGDEYWLEHGDLHPRHLKGKKAQGKSQAPSSSRNSQANARVTAQGIFSFNLGEGNARDEVDDDERAVFRRRLQSSREQDEAEAEANALFDDPRSSKGTTGSTSQSTLGTETQKKAAGKRPATAQLGPAATKKAKQTIKMTAFTTGRTESPAVRAEDDDDDDDDPRAFRRRRR
ncbi:DNA damage response protein RcaA [Cercospora zeina]